MKLTLWAAMLSMASVATPMYAQDMSDLTDRLAEATKVVREIENVPDGGIPNAIVSKANCIAVIPSVNAILKVLNGRQELIGAL